MDITPEIKGSVIKTLVNQGHDPDQIDKDLSGLSPDEQNQFFQATATKFGIGSPAKAPETKSATPTETGPWEAGALGLGRGFTGGLLKYPAAALASAIEHVPYSEATGLWDKMNATALKEHPAAYLGGDIAGTVSPVGVFGSVSKAAKLGAAARGAGAGLSTIGGLTLGAGTQAAAESLSKDQNTVTPGSAAKDIGISAGTALLGGFAAETGNALLGKAKPILASLRNISPESIDMYAKDPAAVNTVIRDLSRVGDKTFLPSVAAETNKAVATTVSGLNRALDETLSKVKTPVDIKPVLDTAKNELNDLSNVAFTPEKKSAVNQVLGTIRSLNEALQNGRVFTASELNVLKRDLQSAASSFYDNPTMQSEPAGRAFANIADAAKKQIEKVAPDVAPINEKLQKSIDLQQRLGLPKTVVDGSGQVIGGGMDERKAQLLIGTLQNDSKSMTLKDVKQFDSLFGTDLEGKAELYRAAKDLNPSDIGSAMKNGKALFGMAAGGTVGGLIGAKEGNWKLGSAAGLALGSPYATRGLISAAPYVGGLYNRVVAPTTRAASVAIPEFLRTKEGK